MRVFFDSSAFAKRYIFEPGSEIVDELCQATTFLSLSSISIPEVISALNRLLREKSISKKEYLQAKNSFLVDIEDVVIINITPEIISHTILLLEKNVLRTLDALHISCATAWKPDLFVSSDKRQINAAKKTGLKIKLV